MASEFRFLLYRFQQYNISLEQLLVLLNAEHNFPSEFNKTLSQILNKLRESERGKRLNLKEAEEELDYIRNRKGARARKKRKFIGI
ncbi:MAG: hypothetical protein ABIJ28_02875 [Patescibacteria group bacterium]